MIVVRCTLSEWMEKGPALIRVGAQSVEVVDKKPNPVSGKTYYWYERTGTGEGHGRLVPELFDRLSDAPNPNNSSSIMFATLEEAQAACNKAAWDWAVWRNSRE